MHGMAKLLVFLLVAVAVPPAGYGQEEAAKPEESVRALNIDDLGYRVRGADIPRFHLVNLFLLGLSNDIRNAEDATLPNADKLYELLLADIGVKRRTGAEDSLRRAAKRFEELEYGPSGRIVETREGTMTRRDGTVVSKVSVSSHGRGDSPEFDWKDDDKTRKAKIQAHQVRKAQELADIYYDLLEELKKDGVEISGVERHLYNKIAANTSLASDEPMDSPRPYELAFQERLRMRETGESPLKKDE